MRIRRKPEPESWPCSLCGAVAYTTGVRAPFDMPADTAGVLALLGLLEIEHYCDACIGRAQLQLDAFERRN